MEKTCMAKCEESMSSNDSYKHRAFQNIDTCPSWKLPPLPCCLRDQWKTTTFT